MTKQADDKPEDTNKPWMIRDVPEETRRKVKTFAVQHSITVAEAIAQLVDAGLELLEPPLPQETPQRQLPQRYRFGRAVREVVTEMLGEETIEELQRRGTTMPPFRSRKPDKPKAEE